MFIFMFVLAEVYRCVQLSSIQGVGNNFANILKPNEPQSDITNLHCKGYVNSS